MAEKIEQEAVVGDDQGGERFDRLAAELFGDFSRSRLQAWIRSGELRVDGEQKRPRDKVEQGSVLTLSAELEDSVSWEAEAIALDVLFEDDSLLVVNKPAGLVVHPAAGNREGTLVNALLHHYPDLSALPRGGIVHRLDKDTSGLMVVARSLSAHKSLVEQLQARSVHREYLALVQTVLTAGGSVDAPMGRHPRDRLRMAVVESGKPAVTHYRVLERFAAHTLVQARLETGRTHQIRVHMSHIRCPLVGDPLYGGRPKLPRGASAVLREAIRAFRRQALHAVRLQLIHPASGEAVGWEAEIPADYRFLLELLRSE